MKKICCFIFFLFGFVFSQNQDSLFIRKIYNEALSNGSCYRNLKILCKQAPARLSGSKNAGKAVLLMFEILKQTSDNAWLQETLVPHWERGNQEKGFVYVNGKKQPIEILALGGSVETPKKGIKAKLICFNSLDELRKSDENNVKGKIVFINQKMDEKLINTFDAYGGCASIRVYGADEAAAKGAVGVIIRSLSSSEDDFPHTGVMVYNTPNKIPAAAISTNDANTIQQFFNEKNEVELFMKMNCVHYEDTISHNVIGELIGSEKPNEIIVVGGHLDSWDNGEGAHDDGAGVVHSMEVIYLLKKLGYKPKRTIRCVLFMNEENGARGATTYADISKENKTEKHIVAIESDRGGFVPRGFMVEGDEPYKTNCYQKFQSWKKLLEPYMLHILDYGGSGVDVGKLRGQGLALVGFVPDPQRYFDVHHSKADKFENVNKRELELGSAAITALVYLIDQYGMN